MIKAKHLKKLSVIYHYIASKSERFKKLWSLAALSMGQDGHLIDNVNLHRSGEGFFADDEMSDRVLYAVTNSVRNDEYWPDGIPSLRKELKKFGITLTIK